MKAGELKYFTWDDLLDGAGNLCEFIKLNYQLSEPKPDFLAHFGNYLKKYFGFLTFQQLEETFELHAFGYLNSQVDIRITKFSVQDLTKVIRAYSMFKQIENPDKVAQKQETSIHQKDQVRKQWVDQLCETFRKYRDYLNETHITIPLHTATVLSNVGLIDKREISYTEPPQHLKIGAGTGRKQSPGNKRLKNVKLIYQAFDKLIIDQKELGLYLQNYKYEFSQAEMPEF